MWNEPCQTLERVEYGISRTCYLGRLTRHIAQYHDDPSTGERRPGL